MRQYNPKWTSNWLLKKWVCINWYVSDLSGHAIMCNNRDSINTLGNYIAAPLYDSTVYFYVLTIIVWRIREIIILLSERIKILYFFKE